MSPEMTNIIIEVFFSIVMTVCIPRAFIIGMRLYVVKKFSMERAAEILQLHLPTGSSFSLADLQRTHNNSGILSLYYYWLWLAENLTQLFLFGTLCLFFFGFLPTVLDAIPYTKLTVLILIIIEIVITFLAWFFRYICEEFGKNTGVDLGKIW